MNQCANVSICQPVCAHGATDWHISRMGLFIVPFRFSHHRLLSCVKRVGVSPKESLQKVCEMRQGVESVSVTDFSDSHFGVLQVFQDSFPFLFQYPFVYGHTIEVFEKAAESSGRISSPDAQILPRSSPCCNSA